MNRINRFARPHVSRLVHFLGIAWPGAAVGLAIAATLISAYAGLCMRTGLGTILDVGGTLLLGAIVLTLSTLLVMLGLTLVRRMPRRFVAVVVVASGCIIGVGNGFGFSPDFAMRLAGPPVLLIAVAGAGLSILLRRGSGQTGAVLGAIGSLMLLAAVVSAGLLLHWLLAPGEDPYLQGITSVANHAVSLDVPNPSLPGDYEVATLFYGSGTDRRRPEYGELVDLQTKCVDASPFITNLGGFKAWARRKYWGFGPDGLPLNARVWLPRGDGPFPLVLIVHGNHKMEEFSDPGYAYLGELLASRGFITASIDENFLNGSWTGDIGCENDARGWLLLKHLELWRNWSQQQDSPFFGLVDLDSIALIGHSRGGEAILHAAAFNKLAHWPDDATVLFDFGFSIQTLIAIAPIDGQYEPAGRPVPVENVNYLVLQGSHDSDLDFFAGARSYRRVRFTDDEYRMKAALYIHRANHGQFNTVWGRHDAGPPLNYLLNLGPLLDPEDQRTIAKVCISAFLDATLCGRSEYIPMFRDHRRAAHWLPDTVYFSRFEETGFLAIADFDESIDVTKASPSGGSQRGDHLSVWRQQEMKGRGDWPLHDYAVALGWNTTAARNNTTDVPCYTLTLPDDLPPDWRLDENTVLSFCLADTDEQCGPLSEADTGQTEEFLDDVNEPADISVANEPSDENIIDLTIELVACDGNIARLALSHASPLQPAIRVTFTKWAYWERTRGKPAVEPVLQTYEIPLSDFAASNPDFDPAQLREIRFRFDRTRSRVILLDHVGFAHPPGPAPADFPQNRGMM